MPRFLRNLKGYRPDETPPGGALIFSLWWDENSKQYFLKSQFVAQTLDQMRNAIPLTISAPPAEQDVAIPSCSSPGHASACSWPLFKTTLQHAIDPAFTSIDAKATGTP
jgi:4-phytase/acid phosphatase